MIANNYRPLCIVVIAIIATELLTIFSIANTIRWAIELLAIFIFGYWTFSASRSDIESERSEPDADTVNTPNPYELLDRLSKDISAETKEIDRELDRSTLLINDATTTLSSGFSELIRLVQQQEDQVLKIYQATTVTTAMNDNNDQAQNAIQEISATTKQISQIAANAIRSMQFDDIVTQNIGTVREQLQYLSAITDALNTSINTGDWDANSLELLSEQLEKLRDSYSDIRRRKVSSQSMDEGEIELF